jgi:hypothetical protein
MTRTVDDFADLHHMDDERCAALARELAACRATLHRVTLERDAAQQEAAELADARTASMAAALNATHTTRLSMFGRVR